MYVNKGMSTIKIADELNEREIEPPAVYLKIPTYMKRSSSNPDGKYVWLRAQIGKILKNEVYIGNVVGRKFQKVSHKIAKVRSTRKEEHIVLKNMHEPIIDEETWNKAQEMLNGNSKVRCRKNDHKLKGLIYCGECGSIATLRCREEQRKNGTIWRASYFICSKRNTYSSLCECKQIPAKELEEEVIKKLRSEIKKVKFSEKDIKILYEEAVRNIENKNYTGHIKIEELKSNLNKIDRDIEQIYQDKINGILQIRDFKIIYEKKQKLRQKILEEIKKDELRNCKKTKKIENFEKIQEITCELLENACFTKTDLSKMIEKIEFDKEKNIKIKNFFKKI